MIQEEIHQVVEEESIADANNVTADTSRHTSNKQRENANTIFTSENLDKLDELADTVTFLTINDDECYESNKATTSDAQGDPIRYLKTVANTDNRNEKVTETSNSNLNKKYRVTGPHLSSSWRLTQGSTQVLCRL